AIRHCTTENPLFSLLISNRKQWLKPPVAADTAAGCIPAPWRSRQRMGWCVAFLVHAFSLEDSYRVCRVKNDGTPRSHFPRISAPPRHSIAAAHAAIDASASEMSAL